ncbi:hypothetical protein MTR67_028201 [Solanum verrucosum]|uniref:Uncharacterized protein n=1 Tax=Solanum verrucosum TaxID=315347 RepID=A0AAF0R3N1_SOLVR|nr:hypothetical protein MTR67_028201 [Solanum verrucosum]
MWHSRTPSTDRRWTHGPFCRSVVTDRSSCPWIDAPKAQLQSRTTVDQHGPSFDPRSVGLTVDRRFRFSASRSRLDRFPISSSAESVATVKGWEISENGKNGDNYGDGYVDVSADFSPGFLGFSGFVGMEWAGLCIGKGFGLGIKRIRLRFGSGNRKNLVVGTSPFFGLLKG